MENIFTEEELLAIEHDAASHLNYYLGALVIIGDASSKAIFTISQDKQLVFVEGNDDTGYRHLSDRHSFFSYRNYWVSNTENAPRLDDPSKFHYRMMPIIDFVKIAEAVFTQENKNITRNHYPEIFDKYTGTYCYTDGLEEKYHLLTYKDTKIVHTLFPDKKRHNRKSKAKFGRGIVTTELKFPIGHNDLTVPYENSKGVTTYSILIRKYYEEQIERLLIQKHDKEGNPKAAFLICERSFEGFEQFNHDTMWHYQHSDLTDYEKIINQLVDY